MLIQILTFLVMLNPFALFLYLSPIMKELDTRTFYLVLFKATIISLAIFLIFLFTGETLFTEVFRIEFEAFRIFGGIIIFSYAYIFIVKGQKALIQLKEDLDDLASEIALPFMIGAGTISLTILMAFEMTKTEGITLLIIILAINFIIIMSLKTVRDLIKRKRFRIAFDKNMEIMLRLMGFFIGAIGINMIILGINNLYL